MAVKAENPDIIDYLPTREPLTLEEFIKISGYFNSTALPGESLNAKTGLIKRHLDPTNPRAGYYMIEDGRDVLKQAKEKNSGSTTIFERLTKAPTFSPGPGTSRLTQQPR